MLNLAVNKDPAQNVDDEGLDLTTPDNQRQEPEAPVEDQVPDKFKGKSLTEVIEMYQNAESELGRKRNEIGQMRHLTDELLGITRAARQVQEPVNQPAAKKLTSDELFAQPEESIRSVVVREAEAREKAVTSRVDSLEAQLKLERFEKKHGTFRQTMEDPTFAEWIQKTPHRLRLAQQTVSGDFEAADELFSLYQESRPPEEPENEKPKDPLAAARKAGLARSGGAGRGAGAGAPGGGDRKIWSRAELVKMRITDPDEFDRLQPEILQAYREKRVR